MSAAGSAAGSTGTVGFRGVVSGVLRGPVVSRSSRGGSASFLGVVALLAALLVAAITPAVASAAPKAVFDAFGSAGSGEGEFASDAPQGIAVNQSTGDLFVADTGNHRVQRLTGSGAFASQVGSGVSGILGGLFNSPRGVAVDPDDGSVYVTDGGNLRVQKFSSVGVFGLAWGFNVDNVNASTVFEVCSSAADCRNGVSGTGDGQLGSTFIGNPAIDPDGDVWVADGGQTAGRRAQRFDGTTGVFEGKFGASGTGAGQFGTSSPSRVAVGSDGAVYAVDFGNTPARVQKCVPSGTPPTVTATCTNFYLATGVNTKPVAVTVNTGTAANPGNGNVLIARRNGTGTATNGEVVVDEYTNTGTPIETHAVGARIAEGVSETNGRNNLAIAVRTAPGGDTGRIYLTNGGGTSATGGPKVYVLDEVVEPTATLNFPTGVTASQATFSGTVNPNGSQTTYRFEITTDGTTWTPVGPDQNAGAGGTPVVVSQTATGLAGGQAYQVRLVATKPYGAPGQTSAPIAFATTASEPTVTVGTAIQVAGDRAVLQGTINPNNQTTTYHFEYGTTTSYGQKAPALGATLAPGNTSLSVTQTLIGLKPNTLYHYRLVAVNATGTTASSNRTFFGSPLPNPPAGRAYELVSPADKGGVAVAPAEGIPSGSQATPDGDGLLYTVSGTLPGEADSGPLQHPYIAHRGTSIWNSLSVAPPSMPNGQPAADQPAITEGASEDLSKTVVLSNAVLTPDAWRGAVGSAAFYLRDVASESYQLLTPVALSGTTPYGATSFVGGSADYDQLLIETRAALTPDAVTLPPTEFKLYKWSDGALSLQTVVNGSPVTGSAAGSTTSPAANLSERTTGAISSDGATVFFTSPASSSGMVYRREEGQSILVNAAENPDETVAPGPAAYRIATRDGKRVLFTSTQHLVADDTNSTATTGSPASGTDLYMYTHSDAPELDENLTLISSPHTLGAASAVEGVIGAAADGSRVYFVAQGQLTADAPADAISKAYLWESGAVTASGEHELKYIGTIGSSNNIAWGQGSIGLSSGMRSVSADGEAMMLVTNAQLDADRDNGGILQVYYYAIGEDRWSCVSCPEGRVPAGPARLRYLSTGTPFGQRGQELTFLSADGERGMFESVDSLVPEDVNGKRDVYLWENGEPHLISSGRSEFHSFAVDIVDNGDSVFFTTAERLVARDTDYSRDVYVARVGGGLPDEASPASPVCQVLAGGCQGVGASEIAPQLGTEAVSPGEGNAIVEQRRTLVIGAVSSSARRNAARTGVLKIRVRTNQAGTVVAVARTRVGKRRKRVASNSIKLRAAGAHTVRLRLNKRVRLRLRRGDAVLVAVRVSAPGARTRTIAVRLSGVRP